MNDKVFEVTLFWGLIVDRRLPLTFPCVLEFIAGARMILGCCRLPPDWPDPAGDTDPEVMEWLFKVVDQRRSEKRPWTGEEYDFLDQFVDCLQHSLRASGSAKPFETLRGTLIADLFLLMHDCMHPVWERLRCDVEGFCDLSLDYNAIALTLAEAVVQRRFPGTRKPLPERFSLQPWVAQGYQHSIQRVVGMILHGAIHLKDAPVPGKNEDWLFVRLMTGAIRQGLFVFYLEHVRRPQLSFAMVKFLHVQCLNSGTKPKQLALQLHPPAYTVDEKTGVQCVKCESHYRWKTLEPLTWGCDCGALPIYCPECLDSNLSCSLQGS